MVFIIHIYKNTSWGETKEEMIYSKDNWRKAILTIMSNEPKKEWEKDELMVAAHDWLIKNNIPYEIKDKAKDFEELLKSDKLTCEICNRKVGNASKVFEHMRDNHPREFKEAEDHVNKKKEKENKK